jgi:hypothetical protein
MALRLWPRFGASAAARPKARPARRTLRFDTLEDRTVPAAPVIDPIADITLSSNQAVRQIPIPANDADNDALTFTARAAGTEAYFLATDLGLRTSARATNSGGRGEKWFQGTGGSFFILPSGEFHKWDGTAGQANGPLLATLPPAFFLYPDLVTRPSSADLASVLDARLGLSVTPTPATNTLGFGEKWLVGTGGVKFYITPAGDLFRMTGKGTTAAQTLVAHLDPAYFNDVRLLTDAKPHPLPIQLNGPVVTIGPEVGSVGDFAVEVTAKDATTTARRTFHVHVANAGATGLGATDAQVLGAGEQVLHVQLGPTDGDGDAITYQVRAAGTEAFFLATDLGLKPDARHRTNWGGQGEKWFVGKDGWYFLKPSGDFLKWDGTDRLATGQFITTLQPAYFYYPDLLTKPQDEDLAYVLDRKLGLSPTITPAENSLGQGERWLKGRRGYFFVTPAGDLYQQGTDSPLLASLGGSYFAELNRLYAAQPDRFAATAADGVLTVTTKPNYFGSFVVQVKATDGVHTTTRLIPVEQRYVAPPPGSETTDDPRVVAALSTGNKKLVVTFSRAMSNTALDPTNYGIVTANVNPEAGGLVVTAARFTDAARDSVELTTLSQSSVAYTVAVVNVRDLAGHQIAPREVSNGVVNDPSRADFAGSGPSGADRTDTDGDGLTDDQEQTGWDVQVTLVNGRVITRGVTSDPYNPDTDGDGLPDAQEANLRLDPRDADTDDDQLTDAQEFNEVYSDPTNQDTDGDGLDDNIEFGFFKTSPNQPDTDGDQLPDGAEVLLGSRNARVADLPAPSLRVSDTRIGLDVRFTETTSTGTRTLDSRNVSSTLTQSQSKSFSNTSASEYEIASKLSFEYGYEITAEAGSEGGKVGFTESEKFGTELSTSGKWSTSNTTDSTKATEDAYAQSLTTDKEKTEGAEVVRSVDGATLQATVFLRNLSNLGYRVKNLQLTASIQDPQDPTRLTPVATLVPDAEPADGFTLGPLGADKGPIIFSNTTIFPSLAESLMKNPRGLVYQFSNYDLVDEFGRNFAFTARDVVDRTSSLVIDYGGFDSDGDGEGDFTEYKRVSTSGGRVIDTNGDGVVDGQDHRVLFDADGKEVGVTLRDALAAIGLTHYDEATTPSDSLSEVQLKNSYSTTMVGDRERIFRIRTTGVSPGSNKNWEVITRTGIDRTVGLDDVIMTTDSGARLAFVQDLDGDGLPANLEFLNGTSDTMKDTDGDGLDDRFELLIGWDTEITPQGTRHVYSEPTLADSDRDGIPDGTEAPSVPFDRNGDGMPDEYRRDPTDANGDGKPDDLVTDPSRADTDGDGIDDNTEITGYDITLYQTPQEKAAHVPPTVIHRITDPTNVDTDGDTAPDGVERRLGGDPTDPGDRDKFADDDRDGLVNVVERDGWDITVYGVSTRGFNQGLGTPRHVSSDPANPDTDGDGLLDGAEYQSFYNPSGQPGGDIAVRTDPQVKDTDGDGLGDKVELLGFNLRDLGVIVLDPADADTDNDKLSDGEEAELQSSEPNWWVVRVVDANPYRVFSDPRVADQDFDRLVDGDEKFVYDVAGNRVGVRMSDPTKANTDGDTRSDLEDVLAGLNPLEEDYRVTVSFRDLFIKQDGDEGSSPGEIAFDLGVQLPDSTNINGLSNDFTSVLRERWQLDGTLHSDPAYESEVGSRLGVGPQQFPDPRWLNMDSGTGVSFAGLVPDADRSISFSITRRDQFAIGGVVVDVDNADPVAPNGTDASLKVRNDNVSYVYLGGLDGATAVTADGGTTRTVFSGNTVAEQIGELHELKFDTTATDCVHGANNDSHEPISVTLRLYYQVT